MVATLGSIELGELKLKEESRGLRLSGKLEAGSSAELDAMVDAIDENLERHRCCLTLSDGREFSDLRMDEFRLGKREATAGRCSRQYVITLVFAEGERRQVCKVAGDSGKKRTSLQYCSCA